MKSILLGSVVVILLHVYCAQSSFEEFFRTWTVHHSDNFEAYLRARNVPWFMRQMIKLAKLQRTYRNSTSKDGYYECILRNDNDKAVLWTFKLDEDFVNEYLEGKKHTIKITYDGKVMNETHSYVNNRTELYQLSVDEDGYLVIVMKHGDVTARRFYKSNKKTFVSGMP